MIDEKDHFSQLVLRNLNVTGDIGKPLLFNKLTYLNLMKKLDKMDNLELKGKKLLDAGCGMGIYSGYFKEKEAIVTGVDKSPELIEIAKKSYKGIKFFVCSLKDLHFNKEFDIVFCCNVLMHITDYNEWKQSLVNLKRAVKPGGKLIIINNFSNKISSLHQVNRLEKQFSEILNLNKVYDKPIWGFMDTIPKLFGLLYKAIIVLAYKFERITSFGSTRIKIWIKE